MFALDSKFLSRNGHFKVRLVTIKRKNKMAMLKSSLITVCFKTIKAELVAVIHFL